MRLLVVEDEKRLAASLKGGLEREGFAVDIAFDGEEGEWLATETAYDAIVMDIMLPRRNGYQLCSRLRERGVWTPILMLTAKDGDYDQAEALDTGADDFLSKPFSYVVLLARIRALVRRGAAERPAVLQWGTLTLDPATRSCRRAGERIELTAREFSVLEYLMRRRGDLVTKAEILDHVWDLGFDGDPNVVEVHVSALRRKVDKPFGVATIETVRGGGYRLAGGDDPPG
ncbi:MAG TPA: response regulator transcription factor [Acidimicrobiales bacterium]|nr:response regulator transcription factor [Acidimicrobiales bacterium]